MELSEKCFQELILTDQNHPAALINYAAFLLCKYGSTVVGMCLRWFVCLLDIVHIKGTLLMFSLLFCKYWNGFRHHLYLFPFGLLIRTLISSPIKIVVIRELNFKVLEQMPVKVVLMRRL